MRNIGSRELKNRLGRYLRLVRKGQAILVTDRGRPVAKLVQPEDARDGPGLDEKLKELAAAGHLRLGTRAFARFKPIRGKGKPASRLIIEGRK